MTRRGRWWALTYLGLVAATVLFVLATFTVMQDEDGGANLAGVWLFVVTLPWSMLLSVGARPGRTPALVVVIGGLAAAAALNAALLGWLGDRSADRG